MENQLGSTRRRVLKAVGLGGLAASGVVASSGGAAAQSQALQIDSDNLVANQSLLSITLQNTNVLNNVNVEDVLSNIDVTVQNVDVTVTDVIDIGDVSVVLVNVENALNQLDLTALNNVDVQVAVLGANRSVTGSETVQAIGDDVLSQ